MNYPPANVWWQVQLDPKPEPEPEVVRANPGHWPVLHLPAEWPEERRKTFAHVFNQRHERSFSDLFGSKVLIRH